MKIVSIKKFLGQTSNISSAILFIPIVSALYRISVYTTAISATPAPALESSVNYADENGSRGLGCGGFNNNNPSSAQQVFHAVTGTNVTFSTIIDTGTPTYDVFIVVEELDPDSIG